MARRISSACSTCSSPAASARRVCSWASRDSASRMVRCAARRVVWVWWASQFAVEVAPAVAGDVDGLGVGQESGFEGGELGLGGLDLADGGGGLVGVHRPQRQVTDLGELVAHRGDRTGDPVGVVGGGCHGTNPSTDHRQSSCSETRTPQGESAIVPGFRDGRCATSSTTDSEGNPTAPVTRWAWCTVAVMEPIQAPTTDSPPGSESLSPQGIRRSRGGFETVAGRPPQPPEEANDHTDRPAGPRRQPDSQPPLALTGAVNPPRTARKAPKIDSPGERQTLGYRVADIRPGPGVSRRSLRDLLNHRYRKRTATRHDQSSQGLGGNPIASPPVALAGAVNPPPNRKEGSQD